MLADPQTAPIPDPEKALLAFIAQVTLSCHGVRSEDVARLRAVGWRDEAIYDAVFVCALFNLYNRWIDACGVHAMSDADHEASGRRLAQFGYLPPQERQP